MVRAPETLSEEDEVTRSVKRGLFVALVVLAGCTEADKVREANRDADAIECNAKGGTMLPYHGCVKIDSVIPLTGPRIARNPTLPEKP